MHIRFDELCSNNNVTDKYKATTLQQILKMLILELSIMLQADSLTNLNWEDNLIIFMLILVHNWLIYFDVTMNAQIY